MYLDGLNFRRIGRLLDVHHTSVMNWVNAYADTLDEAPVPDTVETIEMDELYTYVGVLFVLTMGTYLIGHGAVSPP